MDAVGAISPDLRKSDAGAEMGKRAMSFAARRDFDPNLQPHESAFLWCYRGVCLTRNKIEHVYDRASDVLLP